MVSELLAEPVAEPVVEPVVVEVKPEAPTKPRSDRHKQPKPTRQVVGVRTDVEATHIDASSETCIDQ